MVKRETVVFGGSIVLVVVIWLINYPYFDIAGDTAVYATLGRSLWETGRYTADGVTPYAMHMPFLPIISYPFTELLTPSLGMRVLGLLLGIIFLFVSYILLKRFFPKPVALAVVPLLALNHGFNYLVLGAGSDLPHAILFLLAVLFLHRGLTESPKWFWVMGICTGLACLTRYNAVFLFPLAAGAVLVKYRSLKIPFSFYGGMMTGVGLFSLWFLRNFIVFGSPFYSEYTSHLSKNIFTVIWDNIVFHLNPLHNILPVLFIFLLYGLWKHARANQFLLWVVAAASALAFIWTYSSGRFVFPMFPILIGFAVWGIFDAYQRIPNQYRTAFISSVAFTIILSHGAMLCVYSVSVCNVWVDRQFGFLPNPIPLTHEYRYSFSEARDFINQNAPAGAQVLTRDLSETVSYERGVFRDDIVVSHLVRDACPQYQIVGPSDAREWPTVFSSENKPTYTVEQFDCILL